MKIFRMPKFSIFLKLILIVIFFGIIIDIAVFIVIRSSTVREPGLRKRLEIAFINEVGIPPDTLRLRSICGDLNWNARFESPQMNWATLPNVPTMKELSGDADFAKTFAEDKHFSYFYNSRPYTIFNTPRGIFIIEPVNPRDVFDERRAVIFMLVFLTAIIVGLYFILRRLFRPLKQLTGAVHAVGNGNYYVDIPVKRRDELGELALSISSMASKIGNSIKAKEQLLLDVSHELRTPLTRIKLGLEVDSPKEKINDDVVEMEHMITGLLESYRSESSIAELNPVDTDIVELIQETIDEYMDTDSIKFSGTESGQSITLNIDPDKIQTVLRNIISNGLKYSDGPVEIIAEEDTSEVRIRIEDKGIGISDADMPYIFEPFYRADQSRSRTKGGFGLGLSICKKIMDAHHAAINVNSKVDSGSEFVLVFKKA
jgi:signal transduction histidine kinase